MNPRSSSRWTLPIRRWLVLALALGFVVPVFTTGFVAYHVIGIDRSSGPDAAAYLRENVSQWNDSDWQTTASDHLTQDGTEFVLMQNGEELYRSADDPVASFGDSDGERSVETVTVSSGSDQYTAYIYADQPGWTQSNSRFAVPIAAVASLLITLGGIAWFLGRMVVQPLSVTSEAARQVAGGDLDITLQSTRVREVAEVNDAFEAMSVGLRESLETQSELEQEHRLLISSVAHDLRTPLFSLRGYLEGLERGVADTPERRAQYVRIAQEKADALERLIADLSDFTRLEYLDQAPNQEQVNLAELLQRLVDGLQPQAEAKSVELRTELNADQPEVSADSHLLTRAIDNLLDNALRHTPSHGQIRIHCQAADGRVQFSVEDSGPGIPEQDLPHIFSPLYRGESSRNRRTGGTGLGLTIARRIMQAHEGDLAAENIDGSGARFTGTLPSTNK